MPISCHKKLKTTSGENQNPIRITIKDLDSLETGPRIKGQLSRNNDSALRDHWYHWEMKWWLSRNDEKFLEFVISQKCILVGLTSVNNNLQWERLKDMIKLCGFYKLWGNNGALLRNISNIFMYWSDQNGRASKPSKTTIRSPLLKN